MTGKEVETVATLLKRVRERADDAQEHRHYEDGSSLSIDSLAEGMKSLAAAVEMITIEIADLRGISDPPQPSTCPRCGVDRLCDAGEHRPGQRRWVVECRACGHVARGAWKYFGEVPQ